MERQSIVRSGTAPASVAAADISALLPESVSQAFSCENTRGRSQPACAGEDVVREQRTLYPRSLPPRRSLFLPFLCPLSRKRSLRFAVSRARRGQRVYHVP